MFPRLVSRLRSLADGLRSLFRKQRVEAEFDEELRAFLQMAAEEKMKHGMSHQDAHRSVRLEQGSADMTKEAVRSAGWESFAQTCWQDLLPSGQPEKAIGLERSPIFGTR
jgi:hypothetical protein